MDKKKLYLWIVNENQTQLNSIRINLTTSLLRSLDKERPNNLNDFFGAIAAESHP